MSAEHAGRALLKEFKRERASLNTTPGEFLSRAYMTSSHQPTQATGSQEQLTYDQMLLRLRDTEAELQRVHETTQDSVQNFEAMSQVSSINTAAHFQHTSPAASSEQVSFLDSRPNGGQLTFRIAPNGAIGYTCDGEARPEFRKARFSFQPKSIHVEFPDIEKSAVIPIKDASDIVLRLLELFEAGGVDHNLHHRQLLKMFLERDKRLRALKQLYASENKRCAEYQMLNERLRAESGSTNSEMELRRVQREAQQRDTERSRVIDNLHGQLQELTAENQRLAEAAQQQQQQQNAGQMTESDIEALLQEVASLRAHSTSLHEELEKGKEMSARAQAMKESDETMQMVETLLTRNEEMRAQMEQITAERNAAAANVEELLAALTASQTLNSQWSAAEAQKVQNISELEVKEVHEVARLQENEKHNQQYALETAERAENEAQLSAEIARLQAECEGARAEALEMRNVVAATGAALEQAQTLNTQWGAEEERRAQYIVSLEARLHDAGAVVAPTASRGEIDALTAKLESCLQALHTAQDLSHRWEQADQERTQFVTSLESAKISAEHSTKQAESSLRAKQSEITALQANSIDSQSLQANLAQCEAQLLAARSETERIRAEGKGAITLRGQLMALQGAYDELESIHNNTSTLLNKVLSTDPPKRAAFEAMEQKLSAVPDHSAELARQRGECEELRGAVAELEANLSAAGSRGKRREADLEGNIAMLEENVAEVRRGNGVLQARIVAVEAEKVELASKLSAAQSIAHHAVSTQGAAQHTIEGLETQVNMLLTTQREQNGVGGNVCRYVVDMEAKHREVSNAMTDSQNARAELAAAAARQGESERTVHNLQNEILLLGQREAEGVQMVQKLEAAFGQCETLLLQQNSLGGATCDFVENLERRVQTAENSSAQLAEEAAEAAAMKAAHHANESSHQRINTLETQLEESETCLKELQLKVTGYERIIHEYASLQDTHSAEDLSRQGHITQMEAQLAEVEENTRQLRSEHHDAIQRLTLSASTTEETESQLSEAKRIIQTLEHEATERANHTVSLHSSEAQLKEATLRAESEVTSLKTILNKFEGESKEAQKLLASQASHEEERIQLIQEKEEEVKTLKKRLTSDEVSPLLRSLIGELEKECAMKGDLIEEMIEAEKKMSEHAVKGEELQKKYDIVCKEIEEMKAEKSSGTNEELLLTQEQLKRLEKEASEQYDKIVELQNHSDNLSTELSLAKEQMDQLDSACLDFVETAREKEATETQRIAAYTQLEENHSKLRTVTTELETENIALQQKISEMSAAETQRCTFVEELEKAAQEGTQHSGEEDKTDLTEQMHALQQVLSDHEAAGREAEALANERAESEDARIAALRDEEEKVREKENLIATLEAKAAEFADLETELSENRFTVQTLQEQISLKDAECEQMKSIISNLEETLETTKCLESKRSETEQNRIDYVEKLEQREDTNDESELASLKQIIAQQEDALLSATQLNTEHLASEEHRISAVTDLEATVTMLRGSGEHDIFNPPSPSDDLTTARDTIVRLEAALEEYSTLQKEIASTEDGRIAEVQKIEAERDEKNSQALEDATMPETDNVPPPPPQTDSEVKRLNKVIDELKEELAEAEEEHGAEVERLETALSVKTEVNQEVKRLNKIVDELTEQNNESQDEIQRLEATLEGTEQPESNQESNQEVKRLNKIIDELTEQLSESQDDIQRLETTLGETQHSESNPESNQEAKRLNKIIDELTEQLDEAEENHTTEVQRLETALADLQQLNHTAETDNPPPPPQTDSEVKRLSKVVDELKEELAEAEEEHGAEVERLQTLSTTEEKRLNKVVEELTEQLNESQDEIQRLESSVQPETQTQTPDAQISQIDHQNAIHQLEATLSQQTSEFDSQIAELKETIVNLNNSIITHEAEITATSTKLAEVISQKEIEMTSLKSALSSRDDALEEYARLEKERAEVEEVRMEAAPDSAEMEGLREQANSASILDGKLAQAEETIARLRLEAEGLEGELVAVRTNLEAAEAQLGGEVQDSPRAARELEDANTQRMAAEAELHELRTTAETYTSQTEQKLATVQQELEELREAGRGKEEEEEKVEEGGKGACELAEKNKQLKALEKQLDEMAMLRDDLEDTVEQMEAAEASAEKAEKNLAEAVQKLNALQTASEDQKKAHDATHDELVLKTREASQYKAERDTAQLKEEAASERVKTLLEKTVSLQEQVDESLKVDAVDAVPAPQADTELSKRVEELERALESLQTGRADAGSGDTDTDTGTDSGYCDSLDGITDLQALREAARDSRAAEADLEAQLEEAETKIAEAEEEVNASQRQLFSAEEQITTLTEAMAREVERAMLSQAEAEELRLASAQRDYTNVTEFEDLVAGMHSTSTSPDMHDMLDKMSTVISDLKDELSTAREEARRAKLEGDTLRQSGEQHSTDQQALQQMQINADNAVSRRDIAEAKLTLVEKERDDALSSLAASVAKQLDTAATLAAHLDGDTTSAKAVHNATCAALRERIASLEADLTVLRHRLDDAGEAKGVAEDAQEEAELRCTTALRDLQDARNSTDSAALQAEDRLQTIQQLEHDLDRANDRAEASDRALSALQMQLTNEGLGVEPLTEQIERLIAEADASRQHADKTNEALFAAKEEARSASRRADIAEQDLSEAVHLQRCLEDEVSDYQNTVTALTEEMSVHRRLSSSTMTAPASSESYALRIKCTQLEQELSMQRRDPQDSALIRAIEDSRALSESEGALLAEAVGRTLRTAAELIDLCPQLRSHPAGEDEELGLGLSRLGKCLEALVRAVNRKMQAAEEYLSSFTAHLGQLGNMYRGRDDPLCSVLLGHHREVWCRGAEAAYAVVAAAHRHTKELLERTEGLSGAHVVALVEELTQARADADMMWAEENPSQRRVRLTYDTPGSHVSSPAGDGTPLPGVGGGGGGGDEGALRRELAKLRAENKRLYALMKSLKSSAPVEN